MRYLVLGTAGHIDHGKSALVEALTGTHPDRLAEEKRRGITIDLGFADLALDGDRVIAFVDVPGHERFVRHMVAGATGIDAVLLVVAADEGVKPQTREHLAICGLLEIRQGIVAVTKADLVEPEILEVAVLELRDLLAGTFLEGAPTVPVSARTGAGLDRLREALARLFDVVPERPGSGVARLPVDRSFVLRGFGTVVTGTLASGSLSEGDEIEILPGGRRAKIRGLQVHHRKEAQARAGQRTAVNLQGVDCDAVPRGSTLTQPGGLPVTRRALARVRLLPSAPETLGKGGIVRFHQGTCERSARLRILARRDDGDLDAEVLFRDDTVLLPGDRFVLRRPAPVDTVGGGAILDVRPPASRDRAALAAAADARSAGTLLAAKLVHAGAAGRALDGVAIELGLRAGEAAEMADTLIREGKAVGAGAVLVDRGAWEAVEASAERALSEFHRREPLRDGMPRESLRQAVARGMSQDVWRALLDGLARRGSVRLLSDRVASAGHRVVLSERDIELASRMMERLRAAGLDPPDPATVTQGPDGARASKVLDVLVAEGKLVRIRDGRLFHREALEELERKLRDFAKGSKTIDVGAFKELAGVTRKNAIPLLEHLDAERKTRRVGNVREILIG